MLRSFLVSFFFDDEMMEWTRRCGFVGVGWGGVGWDEWRGKEIGKEGRMGGRKDEG